MNLLVVLCTNNYMNYDLFLVVLCIGSYCL